MRCPRSTTLHLFFRFAFTMIFVVSLFGSATFGGSAQEGTPISVDAPEDPTPEPTAAPTDTPTPTETATPTPTDTSTPEPTDTSTSTMTPTSTRSASPTRTPKATRTATPTATGSKPVSGAATGTAKIKSIDKNGHLVKGVIYPLYTDAGNGTIGSYLGDIRDSDRDGYVVLTRSPGKFIVAIPKGNALSGFGSPDALPFAVVSGTTKTYTVTFLPLSSLTITTVDKTTAAPVAGACFQMTAQNEPYLPQRTACDGDDGAGDGSITIKSLERASYTLHQTNLVPDYIHPSDRTQKITALNTAYTRTIQVVLGGRIEISMTDNGQLMNNTCGTVFTTDGQGNILNSLVNKCDSDDGTVDGVTTFRGIPAGDYKVGFGVPIGYVGVEPVSVHVVNGATVTKQVAVQHTGVLTIHVKNDSDETVASACFQLYSDNGPSGYGSFYYGQICDAYDANTDGTLTVNALQPGNYRLWQVGTLRGYFPIASVSFTMPLSDTSVDVVFGLGSELIVHSVNETNAPLTGTCFGIIQGIYLLDSMCDEDDGAIDGTASIDGLPPGDYSVTQTSGQERYAPEAAQAFTVNSDETHTFTFVNLPYGSVLIHTKGPTAQALPDACFGVRPAGQTFAFPTNETCDNGDGHTDGDVRIDLPAGSYDIVQTQAPNGYVIADPAQAQIVSAQTTEIDITDPTPSTLIIHTVEGWGAPKSGLCWYLRRPDQSSLGYFCDADDGHNDGLTHVVGLRAGDYTPVLRDDAPPGYKELPQTPITLGSMTTLDVTIMMKLSAKPKLVRATIVNNVTSTSADLFFEADQLVLGRVDYGTSSALGSTAPGSSSYVKTQTIAVTGLLPDTSYSMRVQIENGNGQANDVTVQVRTRPADATGTVVVKTVNSSSRALAGACYVVFFDAGGGALGDGVSGSCDEFDADPANGTVSLGGLLPDDYVLVQSRAPAGKKLAGNVRFSLGAGATKTVTVKNVSGGAAVTAVAWDVDHDFNSIVDVCWAIYTRLSDNSIGNYVSSYCDAYDGLDGQTVLRGLPNGGYYLWETYVPDAYAYAPPLSFDITSSTKTLTLNVWTYSFKSSTAVVAKAVDNSGNLIPGACFAMYPGSGQIGSGSRFACDGDDGHEDGQTYFFNVEVGSTYVLIEYWAPVGYQVGSRVSFKMPEAQKKVKVTLTLGGHALKITNVKGSGTTPLPGACFALTRQVGGHTEFLTFACDSDDGAKDGVTRITALPPGTYQVIETVVPAGYTRPVNTTVTMGSSSKSITVHTSKS